MRTSLPLTIMALIGTVAVLVLPERLNAGAFFDSCESGVQPFSWVGSGYSGQIHPSVHYGIDSASSEDSIAFVEVEWFVEVDSELIEIKEAAFLEASSRAVRKPIFERKQLDLVHRCEEICESWLMDVKRSHQLILPSSFDQGILGLEFAPNELGFLLYSSYDGPDFQNWIDHRAELFVFTIGAEEGIESIHPAFMWYTSEWSIDQVHYLDTQTLALKVYSEARTGANENALAYRYFKLVLP